jgi:hypothetical protein
MVIKKKSGFIVKEITPAPSSKPVSKRTPTQVVSSNKNKPDSVQPLQANKNETTTNNRTKRRHRSQSDSGVDLASDAEKLTIKEGVLNADSDDDVSDAQINLDSDSDDESDHGSDNNDCNQEDGEQVESDVESLEEER